MVNAAMDWELGTVRTCLAEVRGLRLIVVNQRTSRCPTAPTLEHTVFVPYGTQVGKHWMLPLMLLIFTALQRLHWPLQLQWGEQCPQQKFDWHKTLGLYGLPCTLPQAILWRLCMCCLHQIVSSSNNAFPAEQSTAATDSW